jgi:transposase-like protein
MIKSEKTVQEQESIIAEYLLGDTTFRKLGIQHGVDFRIIHYWVKRFQGKLVKQSKPKIKSKAVLPPEDLSKDVKQLQEELRKAKLHNKLLNAIIDIAEEQLKIDIRKKSGTKQ